MKDLQIITEHQVLDRVFKEKLWSSPFSKKVIEASKPLVNSVSNIEIYEYGTRVVIEADVEDLNGRIQYVEVAFINGARGVSIATDCNCGARGNCKHATALLANIGNKIENESRLSGLGLDEDVSSWLVDIEVSEKISGEMIAKKKVKKSAFLAYCLVWDSSSQDFPELVIHKGKLLKRGTFIDSYETPAADPLKPSSFMDGEDTVPCTLIYPERDKYSGEINLNGPKGYDIIQAILKTGRVYHLSIDEEGTNCLPNPVKEGEKLSVKPIWRVNSDGSKSPTLDLPTQSFLLPCDPPCVLVISDSDTEPSKIHPLETNGKSAGFLNLWHKGPTIPAEKVHRIVNAFSKLKLDKTLPTPPRTKTKKIAKKKPIPRLHLYRKNPFTHGGLHLSGKPEPIIGELSFDYNKGCIFKPDLREKPPARAKFTTLKGNDLLEITRDTSVETKCIMMLIEGTCLIPSLMVDARVKHEYYSSYLPRTNPSTWDSAIADFITNAVPLLEKMDWQITIDKSAELEVTLVDSDSLRADLVDHPDHEIDWFQFAASYTAEDGKEHSLIPFIGEVLQQIPADKIDEMINSVTPNERVVMSHPDTNELVSFPWLPLLHLAKNIIELFGERPLDQPLHRIEAAGVADTFEMDNSDTMKALAKLGNNLKHIDTLAKPEAPKPATAQLRDYQLDGFHWMQFLARHSLNGILADDMGLGKTLQALTHIKAEIKHKHTDKPSLVIAPTSVVGNWAKEATKFYPDLTVLLLHGQERKSKFDQITKHQLVLTTYPLIVRDFDVLKKIDFHLIVLDEAQYIKNHATKVSQNVCNLSANHKLSLSGTPLENHLGELWSQMRFLMPGILGSQQKFTQTFRTPIEKHKDTVAQQTLNSRVAPLVLRRTKEKVAKELPKKTTIIQTIPLNEEQIGLYETVRASMDVRVREAIADKGLAKSQIIVLDALLKLRQICCHPQLLKLDAAKKVEHSAKLDHLTNELLPQLIEEGRKVLLFSSFTSMLSIIEKHIKSLKIPYSKITGATKKRQQQIDKFQDGDAQIFLISLKAGGTGLNLTAADTVIHYDPWWNPAAENQATDRAHRIGQDKPVFVHKLISEGSIEEKIQELQAQKSALLDALLTEETTKLKMDQETLSNLLAPI